VWLCGNSSIYINGSLRQVTKSGSPQTLVEKGPKNGDILKGDLQLRLGLNTKVSENYSASLTEMEAGDVSEIQVFS
jgi:hypothetical protein